MLFVATGYVTVELLPFLDAIESLF